MKNLVYYRIGGHLIMLYSLTVPLAHLGGLMEERGKTNPDIKVAADLQTRFATIWNVLFQIFYASMALVIDLSAVLKRDSMIPEGIKRYRYTFFAGIVFPVVCGVQMFWVVYFYDRELVFKKSVQEIISQNVNLIVHTLVLVYAFWELVFLPREHPEKNDASWWHLHVFNVVYIMTTYYTRYVDIGTWPYIVLNVTAGTFMFPVILFSLWTLSTIGYYLQWPLKTLAWRWRDGSRPGRRARKLK